MTKDIEIINPEIELYRKIALDPKRRPKITKLFKNLGYTPHKGQKIIIDVMDKQWQDYWFFIFIIARRFGKSFFNSMIAATDLAIPYASVLVVAPVSKQAQNIFNETQKHIKRLGISITSVNNNEMTFTLENGSKMKCGTEKNLSASEGDACSTIIIEEAGLMLDLDRVLGSLTPSIASYGSIPETGKPLGRIILNGTYKGNKVHKSYYLKGLYEQDKGYMSFNRPSSDNPMNTPEFLESQRSLLDENTYKREYEGAVIDVDGGSVFRNFSRDTNLIPEDTIKQAIDKNSLIIAGLDIGATDESSYLLVKVEKGVFYIFDYWSESNLDEGLIAERIKEIEAEYNIEPEFRFIDPSAKLTRLGLANNYDIVCYPGSNAIKESIKLLNQLFRTKKLFIADNLNKLIEQIEMLEWRDNPSNNSDPFKRVKGHHFDLIAALRYVVYTYATKYMDMEVTTL